MLKVKYPVKNGIKISNKLLNEKHKTTQNSHTDIRDLWIRTQFKNIILMIQLDVISYKNVFNETYISMLNSNIDYSDHLRCILTKKAGFFNAFKNC